MIATLTLDDLDDLFNEKMVAARNLEGDTYPETRHAARMTRYALESVRKDIIKRMEHEQPDRQNEEERPPETAELFGFEARCNQFYCERSDRSIAA